MPKPLPKTLITLRKHIQARYPGFAEVELDRVTQDVADAIKAGVRAALVGRQQKGNLAEPLAVALHAGTELFRRRSKS